MWLTAKMRIKQPFLSQMAAWVQRVKETIGLTFLLVAAAISIIASNQHTIPVVSTALQTAKPCVIIDPGHGGMDGGASGKGGELEKDINLQIALQLRDMLVVSGFEVIMTRETDISIHDPDAKTIRQQKTSDLHNRLDIMNTHVDAIVVSIHQNIYSQSKYWGAQVFYGPQNPDSQRLASMIQQNVKEMLQNENERAYKKAGKNLFLMANADGPAVLVECGFLSNPEEAVRLCDETYQRKIAFIIGSSLMQFVGMEGENKIEES